MLHQPTHHPGTILLVDDDADLLGLMSQALTDAGHRVETRSTAPSREDLIELRPDVVFLDVELDQENGAAICHAVKHSTNAVGAVVLMSGHAVDDLRSEAAIGQADAFMQKPFSLRTLQEWADHFAERRGR